MMKYALSTGHPAKIRGANSCRESTQMPSCDNAASGISAASRAGSFACAHAYICAIGCRAYHLALQKSRIVQDTKCATSDQSHQTSRSAKTRNSVEYNQNPRLAIREHGSTDERDHQRLRSTSTSNENHTILKLRR